MTTPIFLSTVHIHGTKDGNFARASMFLTEEEYKTGARERDILDFEMVAKVFESSDLYAGGGMRLCCCHSASNGLASRFAARLNTWILAPTHIPWSYSKVPASMKEIATAMPKPIAWRAPSGIREEFFFYPGDIIDEGACWVLFDPQGVERHRVPTDFKRDEALYVAFQEGLEAQWGKPPVSAAASPQIRPFSQ